MESPWSWASHLRHGHEFPREGGGGTESGSISAGFRRKFRGQGEEHFLISVGFQGKILTGNHGFYPEKI